MSGTVVPAVAKHTSTLIFLHGIEQTGKAWTERLAKYVPKHTKLICPTAPSLSLDLNCGKATNAWYDFDVRKLEEKAEGVISARSHIESIIRSEMSSSGIPQNRIALGGFSQGAAMALYTGLTSVHHTNLAGLVALSGWMPLVGQIRWRAVNKIPVLQCHGKEDLVIPHVLAIHVSEILKARIPDVAFHTNQLLAHDVASGELELIFQFLMRVLPTHPDDETDQN